VGGALFLFRRHDVDLAYIVGAGDAKQADADKEATNDEGTTALSLPDREPKPQAKAEPAAAEDTLPGAVPEPKKYRYGSTTARRRRRPARSLARHCEPL